MRNFSTVLREWFDVAKQLASLGGDQAIGMHVTAGIRGGSAEYVQRLIDRTTRAAEELDAFFEPGGNQRVRDK